MKLNLKCALNKYEKIILEYLLDFFLMSNINYIKIPAYTLKKDLNIIPNLSSYLLSLATRKIEYDKNEDEIYYFDIIEKYSLVNNYMYFSLSDEIFKVLKEKNSRFQLYALLFRNKYSSKFLEEILEYEVISLSEQELRFLLDIEDGYSRAYDLERKLINPIIEEISAYLKITINYKKEEFKDISGNNIYTFTIDSSNLKDINEFRENYTNVLDVVNNLNVLMKKRM